MSEDYAALNKKMFHTAHDWYDRRITVRYEG